MSPKQDPPTAPEGEQSRQRNPWWKPTKQERADLAPLSTALGAISLAVTLVQLFVHDAPAALALSAGLAIGAPTALILIRRAISHKVKLRISVMVAAGCAAVLAGVGIGMFIRYITESPAHAPLSALTRTATAQTQQPSNPPPSSAPPSSPSPGQSPSGQSSSPPVTSGTGGSFTTPAAGTDISDGYLSASGTVRNLPPGYRLDLFLKVAYLSVYYAAGDPNTTLTIADGTWSGRIFVGSQGPAAVNLYLVELSPASVQLMNSEFSYQSSGYPSITALGTILARVQLNLS